MSGSNAGTVSLLVGPGGSLPQAFSVPFVYTIPTGGPLPPPVAILTDDTAGVITGAAITDPVQVPGGNWESSVSGTAAAAGTTILHASEEGADVSDLTVIVAARPLDAGAFDTSRLVVTG